MERFLGTVRLSGALVTNTATSGTTFSPTSFMKTNPTWKQQLTNGTWKETRKKKP